MRRCVCVAEDPAPGVVKAFVMEYTEDGIKLAASVTEGQFLVIPTSLSAF